MTENPSASLERDVVFAVAEGIEGNLRRWLRFVGWSEGQWLELQALGVTGGYGERVRFAHADAVASAVALLVEMERRRPTGIYTIANRINPAVATRAQPGRWHDAKKGASTSDRDITHRRVVFIDIDVKRPSGTSATGDEMATTVPIAAAIHRTLGDMLGDDALGYAHSGNGRQVFVALEETPESAEPQTLIRQLLASLAERFTTAETSVDVAVCDAKRLVPAFGTTKRKGAFGIADRPHRSTGFACAKAVRRVDVAALASAVAALSKGSPSQAARPPTRERARRASASDGETDFEAANAVGIEDVLNALSLRDGEVVTCPGCRNTSGVSIVSNGLKCHHQSCASRGVPGHPGFRTVVDVVAEAQQLSPRDAAGWIRGRFGAPRPAASTVTTEAPPAGGGAAPAEGGGDDDDSVVFNGRRFDLTDGGNAERFVAHHGSDIRYCDKWKVWLIWDGARWGTDVRREADLRAFQTVRQIKAEARRLCSSANDRVAKLGGTMLTHGKRSDMSPGLAAMVRIARCLPGVPIVPEQLDRDPWLFNCKNGTLDLRTGELRPHRREDYLTKSAPVAYDADAKAPLWEKFLADIMGGDDELVGFLQRAVGYAMTGCVDEQVMFFLHGAGANGKSTFLRALLDVFGDYGMQSAPDILVARRNESHPTEIADLFGARLVVAQEIDAGRALAEATVKKLTGGDLIKARRMAENFWSFLPTHKFFFAANQKPRVSGVDEAIWRRLKLIPFNVTFPEGARDGQLLGKLLAERAGILRWCLLGCLRWRDEGLRTPSKVVEATTDYRRQEDRVAPFLEDRCEFGADFLVASADLYRAYVQWCEENAVQPVSRRSFSEQLQTRQCMPERTAAARLWRGLRLRNDVHVSHRGGEGSSQNDFDWTDA